MADFCGISGLGDGGTYSRCNFFAPGASGGVVPTFKQLTKGTEGYKTDWNNFGPSVSVAWRPNVQDGWLRSLLGDPDQATLRGGYTLSYKRQGMAIFTGMFGANPGSTISLTRTEASVTWSSRARVAGSPQPDQPALHRSLRRDTVVPDRAAHEPRGQHQRLRAGSRGRPGRHLDARLPALDHPRHGGRGPLRRHLRLEPVVRAQLQRHPRRELIDNGFLDEFRLGDGQPGREQRGRRQPRGFVRLLRPGHRHGADADLSRLLQRVTRCRTTRRRTRAPTGPTPTFAGRFVQANPEPDRRGRRSGRQQRATHQRRQRRPAGQLLRAEPHGERRERDRQRRL